jgi:hypothetical protein
MIGGGQTIGTVGVPVLAAAMTWRLRAGLKAAIGAPNG